MFGLWNRKFLIAHALDFAKGQIISLAVTKTTEFKNSFAFVFVQFVCIKSEFEHLNKDKFGKFIR